MEKSTIGSRLQLLRKKASISQKQLAEVIGVNQNTLSRYETNERQLPTVDAIRLADYFGVSCDYLLRGYSPDNVHIGQETGLSNSTLDSLKQHHRDNPEFDSFTEHLLSARVYWEMNLCVRRCVDVEKRLRDDPESAVDMIGNGRILLDESDFQKYKAAQCFQRILDDYIQKVMADGNDNT